MLLWTSTDGQITQQLPWPTGFPAFFTPKIPGEGLNELKQQRQRNTPVLSSGHLRVLLEGTIKVTLLVYQKGRIGSKVRRQGAFCRTFYFEAHSA